VQGSKRRRKLKKLTTGQDGESEALLFVQKERLGLIADLTEAVTLVKMAAAMFHDPDDRLGMREMWEEKAQKVWDNFYGRIADGHNRTGAETRHTDWIGD